MRKHISQRLVKWRRSNPNNAISHNLRERIRMACFGVAGIGRTCNSMLLGCTIDEFRVHIESLFLDGMSWDNYGRDGWHIDHIIPCSMFCLEHSEEQEICFHWTNMQPMWARDNLSKGNRYVGDHRCHKPLNTDDDTV